MCKRIHTLCLDSSSSYQVLQPRWCRTLQLSRLRFVHVFQKPDLLLGLLDDLRVLGGRAHHYEDLVWLEAQLGHIRIIFKLAALDDDLLALWLDVRDGVELVLELLAGGGRVDFDLVLFALVLYDHCRQAVLVNRDCGSGLGREFRAYLL